MIAVPAMRVRQFGVDFYQAVLTGRQTTPATPSNDSVPPMRRTIS